MKEVVIVSAVRTAIGSYGGKLKDVSATDLGAHVIKAAMNKIDLDPASVEEVIMGSVIQAGLGPNVARLASIKAGLPEVIPSMTVNKLCASGLKSVILASQAIALGDADIIVAGGTENMSMAPYLLQNGRFGYRMGNARTLDSMLHDGLVCGIKDIHMGITAENIAERWGISREEQDAFAAWSQNKTEAAQQSGRFADEIVTLEIQQKRDTILFDTDEFPRHGATAEALGKLKPAFKADGSVTAGNASGVNDGAAALVLMSAEKAAQLGLQVMGRIVTGASSAVDPAIMGVGPIDATRKALKKANWTIGDLDLIESNEAFAAQSLAVAKDLEFDMSKVNVNGGAIALGHPVGCSGARILVTLLHEMNKRDLKKGLSTLCVGGGQGVALLVER